MTSSKGSFPLVAPILFVVVLLAGSCAFTVCQWNECRDAGMSVFYCIKHID